MNEEQYLDEIVALKETVRQLNERLFALERTFGLDGELNTVIQNSEEGEEWAEIPELPGYKASNLGRIKGPSGKILSQHRERYAKVYIRGRERRVHRLVLSAFTGGERLGVEVNHIDGNRYNNTVSNLEWCTHEENVEHARRTGLIYGGLRGLIKIRCVETGEEFRSVRQCAERFGWSYNSAKKPISAVCRGLKDHYHGYHFERI